MTTSDNASGEPWVAPQIERNDTPARRAAAAKAAAARAQQEAAERGYAEGLERGQAAIAERSAQLAALLNGLAEPLADLDDTVEAALVDLACRIARQVVRRELQIDRAQVLVVAREALAALPLNARGIRVILHPDDAQLLRDSLTGGDHNPKWTIVEDPLMTRGGVRVQSERSLVDATVEQRLKNITESLFNDERTASRDGPDA
ncbi:MAG: flagellar assembly protein FliH [Pseudomonadota bacterium]